MGSVQELMLKMIGIALTAAGGLCVIKGGFSVHKNNGGNDDINIAGWKSIASWWAMGAVMLSSGLWMTFMQFFNKVFSYLF